MLPIYIPSRSRFTKINTSGTASKIPSTYPVAIVVPTEQEESYKKYMKLPNAVVIPSPAQGIENTRHWIGQMAESLNQPKFIMMDDDIISFNVRRSPRDWQLVKSKPEDMVEMIKWIEKALDFYSHAGISPRANNLIRLHGLPVLGPPPISQENVRLLRVFGFQTKQFLSVEHGRVPVMEDFDVSLQLLRKGTKNIQAHYWSQDQAQTSSPGGCTDYRTLEIHNGAAEKLHSLHPEFVRLRQKANKGKVAFNREFQNRTEVTIQWKDAFKSSQEI